MSENVQLAFVITVGLVVVVCAVISLLKGKSSPGDSKVKRDGGQVEETDIEGDKSRHDNS